MSIFECDMVILAAVVNLQGQRVTLIQQGRSYLVSDRELFEGCKHDKGFTAEKVEPDLYAWVCNHRCGFNAAGNPDDPTAVRYVRHVPKAEDKQLPLIDWKKGEH